MHILLTTTYGFDPAFPSRPEQIQARALVERGHRVEALEYLDRRYAGQTRRSDWLDGVAVHRARPLGFFAPAALLRLLAAARPAIVHIHHMRNLLSFQTVLAARRLGLPVVMTVHGLLHDGDLVADRERPLEAPLRFDNLLLTPADLARRLARGAHPRRAVRNYCIHAPLLLLDGLIALSHHERDLLIQLGVAPEKIVVLPNAVDLSAFDSLQPSTLRPPPPATVLFLGQLVPRKGFDILARAMAPVAHEIPGVRFRFISHNRAGEGMLRRIAAESGVEDLLEVAGPVSEEEKVRLLQEATVIAAPSRYEGFGIPAIEAMAAGRPIVISDAPACNEVVAHERTGLVVPYGDPVALAAAIVRLLRDQALADQLGAQGRCIVGRYTPARLAADLEQWYTTVIAQGAGAGRR